MIRINGRTPDQISERNEIRRQQYAERYHSDEKFRLNEIARNRLSPEEEREKSKQYYLKNKARLNLKRVENNRKKKEVDERFKELSREYKAAWYADHRDVLKDRAKRNRRKRDAWVGIEALIRSCAKGDITTDELVREIGLALVRANGNAEQSKS